MANRVVINICGEDYTFVAEESAAYMDESRRLRQRENAGGAGRRQGGRHGRRRPHRPANITDELFKAQSASEQLRSQIKGYLDEAGKAQNQVSELKREIFRLQQKLEHLQKSEKQG